ncbi:hypothetical protein [Tenacibaculum sp. 1_MG-2023]|uniref:hypothetical protein n=1 Tax=Tenacibaculum sp. 1_MG-2023 TaxID=3062653 RepID=UPI0026E2E5C4|nr:hypothetical protein [Tenacibaculum sp. 1_MG-2023]
MSVILVSILLTYYNRIPKSNVTTDKLNNPIYQSSDILLKSKSNETNFVIAKKSTSTFVKVLACLLILYIIITPFNQYLNFDFSY